MTKERQALIDRFQKWLDTKPREQIIAAQCATIAEEYAEQLLIQRVVVSNGPLCECSWPLIRTGTSERAEYCGNCGNDI